MAGFTLLEVLVAIAVFAVFSGMAYGGVVRLLENRERLEAERVYWRELTLAFARLDEDLAQARARPIRDTNGERLAPFLGQPTDPRPGGPPSVEFTRGGVLVLGNNKRSDLQRVAYRLHDGVLARVYWPALDRAPATQPFETPLLSGVREFEMRFYQNGGWIDRWPPPGTDSVALPHAVEIRLTPARGGPYTRTFIVGAGE